MAKTKEAKPLESASKDSIEAVHEAAQKAKAAAERPPEPESLDKDFVAGGRFSYAGIPGCEDLEYRNAVYVDNDGAEYPAKVIPLPLNKAELIDLPAVENFTEEARKIDQLPARDRAAALLELTERAKQLVKALVIKGQTYRLAQYKGLYLYESFRQIGDGSTGRKKYFPVANLLVNFSKNPRFQDWKHVSTVRSAEDAGTPAAGEPRIPHFKLKD